MNEVQRLIELALDCASNKQYDKSIDIFDQVLKLDAVNVISLCGKVEIISFIAVRNNFLKHFNKIDIALDTFPSMGNTTTCYTLWMGLPLVTMVGPCFFERVSYSALNNCGLSDLCDFSLKEYQDIALRLVVYKKRRRYIYQNLRGWISSGPLVQPKRFADNMGNAIIDLVGGKQRWN